jgi:hypothetical protein
MSQSLIGGHSFWSRVADRSRQRSADGIGTIGGDQASSRQAQGQFAGL